MVVRVVDVAPGVGEVPMIEPAVVRQLRVLAEQGWGSKRIAAELGIARNTVRSYLRGVRVAPQVRPAGRRVDERGRQEAVRLFEGPAEGNAVVVVRLLRDHGIQVGVRTVQRLVEGRRRELRAAKVATVRFETAPGPPGRGRFPSQRCGRGPSRSAASRSWFAPPPPRPAKPCRNPLSVLLLLLLLLLLV
jgi:hypothetical protein